MNARTAKVLRKHVYGDQSLRLPRRYLRTAKGPIINDPVTRRARYQKAKSRLKAMT